MNKIKNPQPSRSYKTHQTWPAAHLLVFTTNSPMPGGPERGRRRPERSVKPTRLNKSL